MYDIALYGHLTNDRIFEDFKETNAVGAIGNVWHHLTIVNPDLKVYVCPTEIGEALIYVNKIKSERTSIANMSMYRKWPDIKPSRINHICYLNTLKDTNFINYIEGTITADICAGKKLNLDLLKKINYLFISDEDMCYDIQELKDAMNYGTIILHSPTGSIVYDGVEEYTTNVDYLNNINVLGLGDRFAATVLNYMTISKLHISDLVNRSHMDMSTWLERR